MAEAALLAIERSVVSKLTGLVAQEISLAFSAKNELRKLQDSLGTIKATLQAFEEGQYVKTLPIDNWLERLIAVLFDADYMSGEFTREVARQRREQICFCTLDEVWEFSSRLLFNFTFGHRIKEIRKRLEAITLDRKNFHPTTQPRSQRLEAITLDGKNFHPTTEPRSHTSVRNVENMETHSFLSDPSSVIGRNEEKEAIVGLLMDLESDSAQNVPVITILGMPGIGKTTLAKLVFNDETIQRNFSLTIWVCVSDNFNQKTIAKKVIECITGESCDLSQMEVVNRSLQNKLGGARYLLVLDDIWNEDDDQWVQLERLLIGGRGGSKILVTTRSKRAASIMSPVSRHIVLGPLSKVDCWPVFTKRAFRIGGEEMHTTLVPIGREIVTKCQGVPLALTALGSLLHSITDESYWRFVRDNEIWQLTEDVHRNQLGKSINILWLHRQATRVITSMVT